MHFSKSLSMLSKNGHCFNFLQLLPRCKCEKLSDAVTSNPMVLKMAVNYARQHSGQNALRTMVGPLIERVCTLGSECVENHLVCNGLINY